MAPTYYWTYLKNASPELMSYLQESFITFELVDAEKQLFAFTLAPSEGDEEKASARELACQHYFRHCIYDAPVEKEGLVWLSPLTVGVEQRWAPEAVMALATQVEEHLASR